MARKSKKVPRNPVSEQVQEASVRKAESEGAPNSRTIFCVAVA